MVTLGKSDEELIGDLGTAASVDAAVEQLLMRDEQALAVLVEAMNDASRPVAARELCAQLIGEIVPSGLETLLSGLEETEGEVADLCAWGLRFNRNPVLIEPTLFELLHDTRVRVRIAAAQALCNIGVELQAGGPELLAARRDEQVLVRRKVLDTLRKLAEADFEGHELGKIELAAIVREAMTDAAVRTEAAELAAALDNR